MRALAAVAASVVIAVLGAPAAAGTAPTLPTDCTNKPGGPAPSGVPWAQERLGFKRVWSITTGADVATGAAVLVGVVDTGLDARHPQTAGIRRLPGYNVIGAPFPPRDTRDCGTHGSEVTSIIAAQPRTSSTFTGVAPGVAIIAFKQQNTPGDDTGTSAGIARAIRLAIALHVRVLNVSLGVPLGVKANSDDLRTAVAQAQRARLIIVAAAGNDGQQGNAASYPAAYSPQFDNVIAVSATGPDDGVGNFATSGRYVDVAAPGLGVAVAAPQGGFLPENGTSFATPFVTGTVALMLAAHPGLTPAQVRNRLERTADPPPAAVPDPRYGYGIINPYLAVTSLADDTVAPSGQRSVASPLPARAVPMPADRSQEHRALIAALALFGALALAVVGTLVGRGARRRVARA